MRTFWTLVLVSTLYVGAVFLAVRGKTFRWDSDYDSNLPIIAYVVDTVRSEHRFPLWNPYVGRTGISVLGDPLSAVTYPAYLLPMLLFGVPQGLWVVIWLHAFLSGLFMARLLRGSRLRLWGALLYMGAGAFAARVAAGHIEKILSYPWYPLALSFLLRKQTARAGVALGIVVLTGDWYGLLFLLLFAAALRVVGEVRRMGEMLAFCLATAAVKVVPFIREVLPVMERFHSFDPTRGSIPVWLAWLPFLMPFGVSFYDRPALQRALGLWYNWYEYYAFIGAPMVFLLFLPRVVWRRDVRVLLMLLAVGIAYVGRGYAVSPLFGLSPLLSPFRVPQRMYAALTSVVVALVVRCAEKAVGRSSFGLLRQAPLGVFLLATFLVSGYQMMHGFRPPKPCCTQLLRMREKVPMLEYYYGWIPRKP